MWRPTDLTYNYRRTTGAISSNASYGIVTPEEWNQPADIDEERAKRARKEMSEKGVYYAGQLLVYYSVHI